jgi:hypothetical protein
MDIGSAFTFMFDDQDWIKKLAIGGAVVLGAFILSPILIGLALFLPLGGYMLEVLKNVRDGRPTPLPEWADFGSLFSKGLMVFVIGLVYNLPALFFSCVAAGINIMAPQLDSDMAEMLVVVAGCLSCLQVVLSLAGSFLLPAGLIRYAQTDTLGAAFRFGEVFGLISANLGNYVIAVLVSWVGWIIALFGLLLCGVGIFFTYFWAFLVSGNLYGQLAKVTRTSF